MERDLRIYTTNNIIMVSNIYTFNIYHKADILEILLQTDTWQKYDLKEITQIDILTRLDGKNYAETTDTIIFGGNNEKVK